MSTFTAQNAPQSVSAQSGNDRRWRASDEADDRATTNETFGPLHDRFGFTIDVAAAEHNAKLPRYYTREQDGLTQSWAGERVWCNPPYSSIKPWAEKAWQEWNSGAELIVMLLPANRTEQSWWQDLIEPARRQTGPLTVEFLRGRLRFLKPGESVVPPGSRPPFGCCLVIWGS